MMRLAPLLLLLACAKPSAEGEHGEPADAAQTAVPVQLARVKKLGFDETVQAPGATQTLFEHKLKAPYPGRLVKLKAADGAHVSQGEVVAELLSQESDAAIAGAEAMARSAHTGQEKADAARALSLAHEQQVTRELRAPVSGVVLSHAVSEGDFISAGDELLQIAAPDAIVFVAQVMQSDLARVRPGQPASVKLPSVAEPLRGTVHALLPAASAAALAQPVRIDLKTPLQAVGLFGTVTIVIGHHGDALAVPEGALLRDDVSGVTRVATVDPSNAAHWVEVKPGLEQAGQVEVVGALHEGDRVIAAGQVGLPEGAKVIEAR
jgi:membrane fusion protein (multidrug efflux system)